MVILFTGKSQPFSTSVFEAIKYTKSMKLERGDPFTTLSAHAGHTDQDLHFALHTGVGWVTNVNGTFTGWSLSSTLASLSCLPCILGTVICRVFLPGVAVQPYFPSSGIRQNENFPSVDVCFMGRSFLHSMKLSIVFTIGFQQTEQR